MIHISIQSLSVIRFNRILYYWEHVAVAVNFRRMYSGCSIGVFKQKSFKSIIIYFAPFVDITLFIIILNTSRQGLRRGGIFFGGEGGLLAKKGVTLQGLRISEKKEILRKPIVSVLIDSKLCTIYNIAILPYYCNTVPYYENSIAKYHITVTHL